MAASASDVIYTSTSTYQRSDYITLGELASKMNKEVYYEHSYLKIWLFKEVISSCILRSDLIDSNGDQDIFSHKYIPTFQVVG